MVNEPSRIGSPGQIDFFAAPPKYPDQRTHWIPLLGIRQSPGAGLHANGMIGGVFPADQPSQGRGSSTLTVGGSA